MYRDRWNGIQTATQYNALRFFAQLSEELLYYFSHDSFKVPTLNFHYLCVECSSVLAKIEDDTLDKGNLKPILLELVDAYKKDPIIRGFYGDDINVHFSLKNQEGEYHNFLKEILQNPASDAAQQKIKRCMQFFQEDLSRDARYISECISKIRDLITKQYVNYDELDLLQQYTKIFLTELINLGYSQEYLYSSVKILFTSEDESLESIEDCFAKFISCFSMQKKDYAVYLPLYKDQIKEELANYQGIKIADNVFEMFNPPSPYVIKIIYDAMDPEQAKNFAISLVEFCLSISQYCQHSKKSCAFKSAEVVDLKTGECFSLKLLAQPIHRLIRQPLDPEDLLRTCFNMNFDLISAVGLHTSAFETKEPKNQLLNLWTAMEVLIPVERSGSYSRINQISNAVSSMLTSKYFRSLLKQLDKQLFGALDYEYIDLISTIEEGTNQVEKLLALIVLPKHNDTFQTLCQRLTYAPLLTFRLMQYQNNFMTGSVIKELYENHSKRLSWQIMRIYRNRNMIVHDGNTFPFLDLILQNLHFYIDEIIDIFCEKNQLGFDESSAIIMHCSLKEQQYLAKIATTSTIDESNYIDIILG